MKKGKPKKLKQVEIAFGWRDNLFIIDSDGTKIEHPEFYISCLPELAKKNQRCSRRLKWECLDCKKINHKYKTVKRRKICIECGSENIHKYCSKNWKKAKYNLAKFHEHIAKKREYFLWHLARMYAENYKTVIVSKWPMKKEIEYAVDNKTARRLCDGAYSKFIKYLKHKCNEFGTEYIEKKDLSWQQQIDRLTEKAKMEKLQKILKQAKTAVRRNYRARFRCLKTDCERLMMLRI